MALVTNNVAYWKLDDASGNATDASGNGFTLTNNNTVTYSAALINNGANFGSSNTNKTLTISNRLGIDGGPITISCWVKMLTEISIGAQAIATQGSGTSFVNNLIAYQFNGGTRRVAFNRQKQNVSDNPTFSAIAMGTTSFHHLVLTFDGTTLTGYVDNVATSTVTTSGNGTSGTVDQFDIATDNGNYTGGFASAIIDEVGVWSRALSSTEVSQLYNSGAGFAYPFSPSTPVHNLGLLGVGA